MRKSHARSEKQISKRDSARQRRSEKKSSGVMRRLERGSWALRTITHLPQPPERARMAETTVVSEEDRTGMAANAANRYRQLKDPLHDHFRQIPTNSSLTRKT